MKLTWNYNTDKDVYYKQTFYLFLVKNYPTVPSNSVVHNQKGKNVARSKLYHSGLQNFPMHNFHLLHIWSVSPI